MPYIAQEERTRVEENGPNTPGSLNYLITRVVDLFIEQQGLNYTTVNAVVGALECAKLELYRRIAVPYEDKKLRDNGDVYTQKLLTPYGG